MLSASEAPNNYSSTLLLALLQWNFNESAHIIAPPSPSGVIIQFSTSINHQLKRFPTVAHSFPFFPLHFTPLADTRIPPPLEISNTTSIYHTTICHSTQLLQRQQRQQQQPKNGFNHSGSALDNRVACNPQHGQCLINVYPLSLPQPKYQIPSCQI